MSDEPFYESLDEVAPGKTFLDSTELVLNMGPQHPSTHGVLRVVLRLDGEKVNGVDCVLGYLHRGIEKLGENRTWIQFAPFVDRLDYTAAVSNNLGYCMAVEKLMELEVPKRGQHLRVILTELARLASHQLWLGTHVLDIGAVSALFYAFRDREKILDVFEKYCGARLTTHSFRIGGCQWDAYEGFSQHVLGVCKDLEDKLREYGDLITGNRIWQQRTKGVGKLTAEDCLAYAITGPVLRGSGVRWDLRKAQPYSSYDDFDFDIPIGTHGDTFDRYLVRMEEMRQSIRIVRQAVEGLAEGPVRAKVGKVIRPPAGEAYVSIEAPKGELGYFLVSNGTPTGYRIRVRPPSFINLQALEKMSKGGLVADVVANIGTLDIVLGEVDR